jgi:hypothetical protein
MSWRTDLLSRIARGTALTCRDLALLGLDGAFHDPAMQDPHGPDSCACVRPTRGGIRALGCVSYSAAQDAWGPCERPEVLGGGRYLVRLCCRCAERWTSVSLVTALSEALDLRPSNEADRTAGRRLHGDDYRGAGLLRWNGDPLAIGPPGSVFSPTLGGPLFFAKRLPGA